MTVPGSDIAVVMQGPVGAADQEQVKATITRLRQMLPGCQVVLSTWATSSDFVEVGADKVVFSDDPGPLPSVRPDGEFLNNVNRQIVSTRHGLEAAERPFAIKLRADCSLDRLGFLDLYRRFASSVGQERIVACAFFTVDPHMFEHVPYHVSDWFHFGPLQALRDYWACPLMTHEDAVYYGSHPYAPHSTYIDKRFYCRLPTEQHIASDYARRLGYEVPHFHNDVRPAVMEGHERFLSERLIVAENELLGLSFPKYETVVSGGFQRLNCITFLDWLGMVAERNLATVSIEELGLIRKRQRQKARSRALFLAARPVWPFLATPLARVTVNRVLRSLFFR